MHDSARTGQEVLGVVAQPVNLVPLPEVGALLKAGRLGRAVEDGGELTARVAKMLRPLGLESAERAGGEALEVVMRSADGTHYLVDTGTREAVNLETGAAVELPRATAADETALNEARARHAYHSERAANASDPAARANARALADDYAKEIERLQVGSPEPSAEGYDVADAQRSRFQPQPASDGPPAPLWKRTLEMGRDVAQLPKAKAGFDLSATGRQGLPQALAHPTYLKEAFAQQVKAFASEDLFNEFAQSIRNRPDFELMNESGLFLSSVGPEAEEAFASRLADKVPGVRASDRAYSAALDSIRTQAWDNYMRAVAKNPNVTDETYKAIADLVNISTGRGKVPILDRTELGRKVINALNVPFFSPRNTASKFNLISPTRIVKNMLDPATRPVAYLQLRDASRGLATLGTTLGLLHFAGLDVGLNPFSKDFGKVRVGKAVYDLTGGEGYTVRYLAQMARTAVNEARGKKMPKGAGLAELTTRYLRTQLQPLAATGADWWTGKTIDGKPVTSASAALNLITPFVVDDVIKGFQAEGILGAVKASPDVLGVGVNFYDKPKEGRVLRRDVPAPPSESPVPSPSATPAPQLNPDGIVEPAPQTPVPESPETLRQQFKSADSEDSPRVGVLVTPGESLRRVPRGFARVTLDKGTLYLNRRKLKAVGLASRAALREFITHNGFEPLIGKVASVADTSKGVALRTEDARGVELSTSIVPDERAAAAQAAEDLVQFPEAARQEMGTAQEMVARRLAPASPEHAELRRRVDAASADAKPTFVEFDEGAGSLRVLREAMPQVKSQHRAAMVNYLRGRGIAHSLEEVPAGELLPSQAEYSPEKVARALSHEGPERRILVSSDDHVADGHHQWLAAMYEDPALSIPVIRLDAPIVRLLLEMARFPSSGVDDASAKRKG